MEANEYLKIKVILTNLFLHQMIRGVLDISYEYEENYLKLQIVLLKGCDLHSVKRELEYSFENFTIDVKFIHLTKDEFNSNRGDWLPVKYQWLPHVLYSKAEVI